MWQDLARAWKCAESLDYGMIGVNEVSAPRSSCWSGESRTDVLMVAPVLH